MAETPTPRPPWAEARVWVTLGIVASVTTLAALHVGGFDASYLGAFFAGLLARFTADRTLPPVQR